MNIIILSFIRSVLVWQYQMKENTQIALLFTEDMNQQ